MSKNKYLQQFQDQIHQKMNSNRQQDPDGFSNAMKEYLPNVTSEDLTNMGLKPEQNWKFHVLLAAAADTLGENDRVDLFRGPVDKSVLMEHAGLDPRNLYSKVDAAYKERVKKIQSRIPFMTPEAQKKTETLLDPDVQYFRELSQYSRQIRLMDRMLQLCEDDPQLADMADVVSNLRTSKTNSEHYPNVLKEFDMALAGLEVAAGLHTPQEVAGLTKEEKEKLQKLTGLPPVPAVNLPNTAEPNSFPTTVEATLYDDEHLWDAVSGLRPENWGKNKEDWKYIGPDEHPTDSVFTLMKRYAQGSAEHIYDGLQPENVEDLAINPLDTIIINGKTGREAAKSTIQNDASRYVLSQNPKATDEEIQNAYLSLLGNKDYCRKMVKTLLGTALERDAAISILPVDKNGKTKAERAIRLVNSENSKVPRMEVPEQRPKATLWQKFTHWLCGSNQDIFDRIARYDLEQEQKQAVAAQASKLNTMVSSKETVSNRSNEMAHYGTEYNNNLKTIYGSPKEAEKAILQANPTRMQNVKMRLGAAVANQSFDPKAAGVEEDEYSALTLSLAFDPALNDGPYMVNGERTVDWGVFTVNATEDVLAVRDANDEKLTPEVINGLHQEVRALLSQKPDSQSAEDLARKDHLVDCVSRFTRGVLNGDNLLSCKTAVILQKVADLNPLLEKRPDLFEALPQDVRKGIQAAQNMVKIYEMTNEAGRKLVGQPSPSPAQAKKLCLDMAMGQYLGGLMRDNSDKVKESDVPYHTLSTQMKEYQKTLEREPENEEALFGFKKLSAQEPGAKNTAFSNQPLSAEMQALADPKIVNALRENLAKSPIAQRIAQEMENAPSYLEAAYSAGAEPYFSERDAYAYANAPKLTQIQEQLTQQRQEMQQAQPQAPSSKLAEAQQRAAEQQNHQLQGQQLHQSRKK